MAAFDYQDRNFDQFMDLDFVREAQLANRLMGAMPRASALGSERPLLQDAEALIPIDEWPDRIKEKDANNSWASELVTWICDQDGEGSCVSNCAIKQHEVCQARQYGMDKVIRLSPVSLYKVCGSGPGSGSNCDQNIRVMNSRGCLPLNTADNIAKFKHTFPHNGYYTKYPEGFLTTAKLFKDAEYFDISGYQALGTAILRGYPVMYARSGHCIMAIRLFYRNGSIVLGYCNSWGQWGDKFNALFSYGMGYDSQGTMKNAAYGSIALRSVNIPSSVWNLSLAS